MSNDTFQAPKIPRKRGFAVMDPSLVRDLARKGGVAAHRAGTAHEFSPEEARVAGRKGGLATHAPDRDARVHRDDAATRPDSANADPESLGST